MTLDREGLGEPAGAARPYGVGRMDGGVSNVRSIPVPETEPYVDRRRLAEIMGVSVPTVDRMVAAGMPSETWGMRARRFRPSVAIAWARTRGHAQSGDCAA